MRPTLPAARTRAQCASPDSQEALLASGFRDFSLAWSGGALDPDFV
jgi:hypothetical protein